MISTFLYLFLFTLDIFMHLFAKSVFRDIVRMSLFNLLIL